MNDNEVALKIHYMFFLFLEYSGFIFWGNIIFKQNCYLMLQLKTKKCRNVQKY